MNHIRAFLCFCGRIRFEFDKCITCEVSVCVCPINLPVVD
uniref:NADH-plastoquinone oxidoreductase subunit I n=1 Tax=Diplandrorchis sinica TaxID=2866081 RepID=A0A8F9W7G2_9ASPA|nr:NADH-plastoquinone oxidoreductase subunit I [Diplandrorchis sinica]